MKYILDFDRTLFDVERLYDSLQRLNLRSLAGTTESLARLVVPDLLFSDVIAFLKTKQKEQLFILSSCSGRSGEWEDEYQRKKIAQSGVGAFVAEVCVMGGMKGEVLTGIAKRFPSTEPLIFVDDRIEQCLSVRTHVPQAQCFLMVREVSHIGADVTSVQGIPVVHTLAEVDVMIEKV